LLPFHQAVVSDPAFSSEPFTVHTRWIETEFAGKLAAQDAPGAAGQDGPPAGRERITVEVGGRRLEVTIPAGLAGDGAGGAGGASSGSPGGARAGAGTGAERRRRAGTRSGTGGDALVSPMQGTIVKIVAADGQHVSAGDTVVVLEAMKMEQPLAAHKDGTVGDLAVEVGQTVSAGAVICQLRD
jgi:acetyl-CoA/propionyl-CoA carboxylase, biotin carboxylase, biotin carboxyl carrier protein